MSQGNTSSSMGTVLLTFLAGAAIGAVAVALPTPKSGPVLAGDLKASARRAKRKARALADDATDAWDDVKERTALAAGDLQRGVSAAAKDLRG